MPDKSNHIEQPYYAGKRDRITQIAATVLGSIVKQSFEDDRVGSPRQLFEFNKIIDLSAEYAFALDERIDHKLRHGTNDECAQKKAEALAANPTACCAV